MSQNYRKSVSYYSIRVMVAAFWLMLALIWVPQLWGYQITNVYVLGTGAMALMVFIAIVGIVSLNTEEKKLGETVNEDVIYSYNNMWQGISYRIFTVGTHHLFILPGEKSGSSFFPLSKKSNKDVAIPFDEIITLNFQRAMTESVLTVEWGENDAISLSFPKRSFDEISHHVRSIPVLKEKVEIKD